MVKLKHPIEVTPIDSKNEIYCGIYKITSPHGKIYIGQTTNIYKRWHNYKFLKCKGQNKIYNSLKKYGIENHKFEMIHLCEENADILEQWEDYYIKKFNSQDRNLGLNLRGAGKHGKISEESKEKNRKSHLGKVNTISSEALQRREKRKLETKIRKEEKRKIDKEIKRIEKLNKPKVKLSEETKSKIRNTLLLKGGNRTPKSIKKQKDTWNKKRNEDKIVFTKEHRKKLSESGKGRPVSEKTLEHFRKNWKRRPKDKTFEKSIVNIKNGLIKIKETIKL